MTSLEASSVADTQAVERGLLDLTVEVSTTNVTAGEEFALYVLVKNPHLKPIWIHEVNVSLPSDLRLVQPADVIAKHDEAQHALEEARRTAADQAKTDLSKRIEALEQALNTLRTEYRTSDGPRVSSLIERMQNEINEIQEQFERISGGQARIRIDAASIQNLEIASESTWLDIANDTQIGRVKITEPWLILLRESQARTIRLQNSLPDDVALQPSCTAVFTAVITAKRSLIFTPSNYRLQFYVNYTFDPPAEDRGAGVRSTPTHLLSNTVAHHLAVRSSVYSIMAGSILGGGVGSVARLLSMSPAATSWGEGGITVLIAVILSAVAVIFLARKSDAQSFVSVEDFWGGILIGFLVGYTGTSFFEDLTGLAQPRAQ
jgi:hypothetical protein